MLSHNVIMEAIQMIDQQHPDARTITIGIPLLSCAQSDTETACPGSTIRSPAMRKNWWLRRPAGGWTPPSTSWTCPWLPAAGDSVARILEEMGLEVCGTHGATAALALLNDAAKKGGVMASSVGGLSGAFIPVSEDKGMIAAARDGV